MLLYDELVPWYRLVDPHLDHAAEAASYRAALEGALGMRPDDAAPTLLELGSGAGNNAFHLKARFQCTLAEPSTAMLGLSRELNPECEHLEGDMRTLRLERTFDAVLVHDAIMYMTTEEELRKAIETAFVHTRPGGAAVFAPDCTRDSFEESSERLEGEDGERAMRGLSWAWDPDPDDTTFVTEYAFMLRHGQELRVVHDRHVEGLFEVATWRRILESVGFEVGTFARPLDDGETTDTCFVCRRPEVRTA